MTEPGPKVVRVENDPISWAELRILAAEAVENPAAMKIWAEYLNSTEPGVILKLLEERETLEAEKLALDRELKEFASAGASLAIRRNQDKKKIEELEAEVSRLKDGLQDAICFMKDAKKVSIKSRGIQLEAEFFGGV